jgi:HPt (histidine-containing phosphotransfer) domain-containing protein
MFTRKRKAQFIDAKNYPAMLRPVDVAQFVALLKSENAAKRAGRAVMARTSQLKDAVLEYVVSLERAAQFSDWSETYLHAHEIRGLAETVGLVAAGRIANQLCHYLDTVTRRGQTPERMVVMLHVDAVSRAARAKDEATRLGDEVVNELEALASYKLSTMNEIAAE